MAWLAALEGGHRLHAYRDTGGVWTIGAGLVRWPQGRRVQEGDEISSTQAAEELFMLTLSPFAADLDAMTRDDLLQREFDALMALIYNIGVQALKNSTVLKRINANVHQANVAEAWSWWCHDNGQVVPGLVNRRRREVEVYEGGEYRDQGGIVIPEAA